MQLQTSDLSLNLVKYEPVRASIFRNDINNKKIVIILTFLGVSVLGAIILSFVNVHYDFMELRNFYRGYMGRRLLIQEGRLTYRKHPETSPETQKTKVSRAAAACQPGGKRRDFLISERKHHQHF